MADGIQHLDSGDVIRLASGRSVARKRGVTKIGKPPLNTDREGRRQTELDAGMSVYKRILNIIPTAHSQSFR
jgi:hypothetical protein